MDFSNIKDNNYYRKLIVEHYNQPLNKGLLKRENSLQFHHYSNSCVDDFFIELSFNNKIVTNAKFEGIGCSISTAAIDIFCQMINNQDINKITIINNEYKNMLLNKDYNENIIKDLIAFKNVPKQPNRIKCALIINESIIHIINSWKEQNEK